MLTAEKVGELFRSLKDAGSCLDVTSGGSLCPDGDRLFLRTVSGGMVGLAEFASLATTWRNSQKGGFFSEFLATEGRTSQWLQLHIDQNPHRILFVVDINRALCGHLGLRYDPEEGTFEVENILKGSIQGKGYMTTAVAALCGWTFDRFGVSHLFLRSFADNIPALALYRRCGFEETARWPVFRVTVVDGATWKRLPEPPKGAPQRFVVHMSKYSDRGRNA